QVVERIRPVLVGPGEQSLAEGGTLHERGEDALGGEPRLPPGEPGGDVASGIGVAELAGPRRGARTLDEQLERALRPEPLAHEPRDTVARLGQHRPRAGGEALTHV